MQCFGGAKEALDDLFMRGRMRAGHVVSGGGGGVGDGIPAQFRHVEEGRGKVEGERSVREEWYDNGMVLKE
ncbi:hypothetical protein BCR33DRAFT_711239 [Rhizoclosmatium globosum]|uniref:Uncharacterized protein n=1 Tax=Rhizoclosmatium globosum TaxID=329046 RepID=A0A1Y2D451_9FUNG|nr:hypothetical protein BCR33DRAFT_711239 [Rhizoclosmatium globosum]|eukprot:ORY53896.1 hypothetical protein BCR33DRAFT_711239 [Rhizoclosmatium globosum]